MEFELPEATASRLEDAAQKMGGSAQDLVRICVEENVAGLDETFLDAADQSYLRTLNSISGLPDAVSHR